jgi:hypothetical protein
MRNRWTRMICGLAGLALVAGASPAAAAVCGDLNNSDGGTPRTVADATILLQVVSGTHPNPASLCGGLGALQCGDLNASGSLTVADVVILLNAIAGNPTLFPLCEGVETTLACGDPLPKNISTNIRIQKCGGCQANCSAVIDGLTFVTANTTLSIDAGATICGKPAPTTDGSPSVLVFLRDSKINAPGTACLPIIFTSQKPEGTKAPGDWGGVVFNGRAPVNCTGGECLAEGLTGVSFGGGNANDSSGLMRFVRTEFGGFILSPDNETNNFTFNGIGRGSDFSRLQAHLGTDDGLEWFGGTMRAKFLVSSGNQDDQLDWQLGYTGANQFALAIQDAASLPAGGGLNGYEADNNENGFENTPRSNPTWCNVTLIGTKSQGDTTAGRFGAQLRRGTAGTLANQIFMDFSGEGINIADASTATQGCTTHALKVQNSLFFNNGATGNDQAAGPGGPACTGDAFYESQTGLLPATNPSAGPNPGITTGAFPTTLTNQYIPTNTVDTAAPDCKPLQSDFFDAAAYKGAFVPGGTSADNWMISCPAPAAGQCNWVDFDPN